MQVDDRAHQSRIYILDTTLRDGEQAPGNSMPPDVKVQIGIDLENLGVDVIEAGFPVSSEDDYAAMRQLAKLLSVATLACLARATTADVSCAAQALAGAWRSRIHVFTPVSDLHLFKKLGIDRSQNIRNTVAAIRQAYDSAEEVQFGCEDATRSDPEYLAEIVLAASDAGASVITIADTVGYCLPDEFARLISRLVSILPDDGPVLSVHCHNDLGLAVANSLAGLRAGARQVECTINGIGERAGNAALEEIVMAVSVRKDAFCLSHGLRTEGLYAMSQIINAAINTSVARHKPIVGQNVFAHEAGIHQHGLIKDRKCYEIFSPESVGAPSRRLVIGKHSGHHGIAKAIQSLGFELGETDLHDVVALCKKMAARNPITPELLRLIVESVTSNIPDFSCSDSESNPPLPASQPNSRNVVRGSPSSL